MSTDVPFIQSEYFTTKVELYTTCSPINWTTNNLKNTIVYHMLVYNNTLI